MRATHPSVHARRSTLGRLLLTVLTPLLEKNVLKKLAIDVPVVLSMSRTIVLAFAVALLRQIWRAGIAGWPDATLSVAIVLALPLLGALDRLAPADALAIAETLLTRFGVGDVRPQAPIYSSGPSTEPSKFDDHRSDDGEAPAR